MGDEGRARRAARREAYWTRPKPPRDWRYWVGGLGRVLIVTGLLMFGFVAYQLWGTGIEYAQSQNRLENQLEDLFAEAGPPATEDSPTPTSEAATTAPSASGPTVTEPDPTATSTPSSTSAVPVPVPVLEEGDGFAWLDIPSVGVDDVVVVAGVSPNALKTGPGHYPGTPMPGQLGNSAIAGHRTTFGQPFFRLDELAPGDEIVLTTVQGTFVYVVTGSEVVPPDRGDVVLTDDPTVARLTLTTCDPKYTATNRLIVRADLDPTGGSAAQPPDLDYGAGTAMPVDPGTDGTATSNDTTPASGPAVTLPGEPVDPAEPADPADGEQVGTVPTPADVEDAFAQGWFSDSGAWPHVVGWGAVTAGVAALGYLVARLARRRWLGWTVAAVPFVVTLYFFYQNVNRLLPAAL